VCCDLYIELTTVFAVLHTATFFPHFEPRGLNNDAANLWIRIPVTVYGGFVFTVALCLRWLCGAMILAWMQPHGCLAPRDFSVSLNNLTNVKITTVYRRRQNTTQNTLENKIYNNTNPVFSNYL